MRTLALLIILTGSLSLSGQVQDANFWTSVNLSADVTKDLSLSYETQLRFFKNATSLDNYFNEVGVKYDILKDLSASVDYRYSWKNKEDYFEGVHRICLNTSYEYDMDDLGLELQGRVRYQLPFDRFGVVNDNIYPDTKNVMRYKLKARYIPLNLKLIRPFMSFEIYQAIRPKNIYSPVSSYRFSAGFELNLPKRHSVDFYYILEKEYRAIPQLNHIWGIQYNYDLFKDPFLEKEVEEPVD